MRISVVIPAYDDLNGVMMCLNSLQAMQTTDVQYIVSDDASPHVMFPAVISPRVARCERNTDNLGFAGNCNAGAAHAEGDIILFCNQDVYGVYGWSGGWVGGMMDGWDRQLIAAFERPQVGIVGARLLFPDGKLQSAGGLFDGAGQPFHRCLGYSNVHVPEIARSQRVSWTTGAAMAVRRDVWEQLGGFDTKYKMYFEDVDLCIRAAKAGYETWYEPRVTLIHRVGSTGGSPHFLESARMFREEWVDTGLIEPDIDAIREHFWA